MKMNKFIILLLQRWVPVQVSFIPNYFPSKKMLGSRPQSLSLSLVNCCWPFPAQSLLVLVPAELISHIFLSHDSLTASVGQSAILLLALASTVFFDSQSRGTHDCGSSWTLLPVATDSLTVHTFCLVITVTECVLMVTKTTRVQEPGDAKCMCHDH
jgi:hypothetical protein